MTSIRKQKWNGRILTDHAQDTNRAENTHTKMDVWRRAGDEESVAEIESHFRPPRRVATGEEQPRKRQAETTLWTKMAKQRRPHPSKERGKEKTAPEHRCHRPFPAMFGRIRRHMAGKPETTNPFPQVGRSKIPRRCDGAGASYGGSARAVGRPRVLTLGQDVEPRTFLQARRGQKQKTDHD